MKGKAPLPTVSLVRFLVLGTLGPVLSPATSPRRSPGHGPSDGVSPSPVETGWLTLFSDHSMESVQISN